VSYTFSGTLSHCFGRTPSGKFDENVSGSVSASGSGTLSCEGGVSKGAGSASVGGNLSSSFRFMTESAGAAVTVESPPGTSGVIGELVFQTKTPQLCASTGLASAKFGGWGAFGSA